MKSTRLFLIVFLSISSSIQSFGSKQEEGNVEYSVQILISHKHLNATDKKFKGVSDVREEIINGVYKYTTGRSKTFAEAAEIKTKMNGLGFQDAFVVKYKDGQRTPIESAATAKSEAPKKELPKVVVIEEQVSAPAKEEVVKQTPGKEENPAMTKNQKGKPVVGSTIAQTDAEFPGGPDSLAHFMFINKHYPQQPLENGSATRVVVSFTVDYAGKMKNIKLDSHLNKECDAEALRLVHMMPDWKPATLNGAPVTKEVLLPISFYQPAK